MSIRRTVRLTIECDTCQKPARKLTGCGHFNTTRDARTAHPAWLITSDKVLCHDCRTKETP